MALARAFRFQLPCDTSEKVPSFRCILISDSQRFPRDPARRRKWVAAVRREESWIPRKLSAICSLHFEDHCFNTNSKTQKKLKKDAVPTLYLPVYSHEANILSSEPSSDQGLDTSSSPDRSELSETSKQEFRRKIQKQAKKIKRLQYLNRCLKNKIETLEEALENKSDSLSV